MSRSFLCPHCGLPLDVPHDWTRPKIRCTECGAIAEIPASIKRRPPPANPTCRAEKPHTPVWELPPQELRVPRPPSDVVPKSPIPAGAPSPTYAATYIWTSEDENSDPYAVADPDRPHCPNCDTLLEPGSVVCLRCGWDQRERRKHVQEYTPMVHHWDAGMAVSARVVLFLLGQVCTIGLGLVGVRLLGEIGPPLCSWLLFTAITAFLLGSWDRLDLTRDRKGRVELLKTWHICFLRRPAQRIDLRQYEGIATFKSHDAGLVEWLVFLGLLIYVIPALVWWWVAIRQATVQVALTRDHGCPDLILYRGWNQQQAQEIAETLRDAARMPLSLG